VYRDKELNYANLSEDLDQFRGKTRKMLADALATLVKQVIPVDRVVVTLTTPIDIRLTLFQPKILAILILRMKHVIQRLT
jgi:hypothetical protein